MPADPGRCGCRPEASILPDLSERTRAVQRRLPFLAWWPGMDRASVRADLLAGLTGAIIVLPQCVAFAALAGLPPQYGLYCAMVPAVVAALFGSSRHLVSGPTNALSVVLFASLSGLAEPGTARYVELALTVTLLCGAIQLALGLARLGALVNFISHTVIVGFMAAAAIVIIESQLRPLLGIDIPRGAGLLETVAALARSVDTIEPATFTVGLVTLAVAVATRRWRPRWPYMIVAMIAGSLAAAGIEYATDGAARIPTVGALQASLPPFGLPTIDGAMLPQTAAIALAIALLGLTEAVSIARSIATRSGQRIDSNQEFVGQGLSNLAGAFFSSYPSSGSFNRSGVNYDAGACTPLAAISSAGFLVLILVAVAPLAAWLPLSAMAAVLLVVAWGLIDVPTITAILRSGRRETAVLASTLGAGVLVSLEFCIVAGVMLSLSLHLARTARPHVSVLVPVAGPHGRHFAADRSAAGCPQVQVIRIDGSLYHGAVDHVAERLQALAGSPGQPTHLLLVGDAINWLDLAGVHLLEHEAQRLRAVGGGLWLVGLKRPALESLERSGAIERIGRDRLLDTKAAAIAALHRQLDTPTCAACPRRVFRECETLPGAIARVHATA